MHEQGRLRSKRRIYSSSYSCGLQVSEEHRMKKQIYASDVVYQKHGLPLEMMSALQMCVPCKLSQFTCNWAITFDQILHRIYYALQISFDA